MQKIPSHYINASLFVLIMGGILAGFGVFEGKTISIIGFLLSLVFFLNILDKRLLFRNLKTEQWLLTGYVVLIVTLLYLFVPYDDYRSIWGQRANRWYVEILSAVSYAPALLLKGLHHFFDVPIAYVFRKPTTHYPFAVGFWLYWLLLTISIRLYEKVGSMFKLLLIYNFIIGALITIRFQTVGMVMAGISILAWIYIYFPRFGIPTVSKTKWRQWQVRKAGKDIDRAEKRMEKILRKIDRI